MEQWSKQFLAGWFAICPCEATLGGEHGYDEEWGDVGLTGYAILTNFLRSQQQLLRSVPGRTRNAHRFLATQLDALNRQDYLYDLGSLGSTVQTLLLTYRATSPAARAQRHRKFPQALAQYLGVLREGLRQGKVVSKRQVAVVVAQCRQYTELPLLPLHHFLVSEYLPHASLEDGVGVARYHRAVQQGVGRSLDLEEVYDWGYREVARVEALLAQVPPAVEPVVTSQAQLFALVTQWQEMARQLVSPHFELSSQLPLPKLEGGALANQTTYHPATTTSPGVIAYPDTYPQKLTLAMSTAFHEGIPGHHLQLSYPSATTPFERCLVSYPVYGEGWALYAERLMEELGAYDNQPSYFLRGRYLSELVRCYRIVIDIGLHLGLVNPLTQRRWDFSQAVSYLVEKCELEPTEAEREVTRYLAIPGQAICYKLGERELLRAREKWVGDLRSFHHSVLVLGQGDLSTMAGEAEGL
jgi:uncharacterized protein (DUF885 family)